MRWCPKSVDRQTLMITIPHTSKGQRGNNYRICVAWDCCGQNMFSGPWSFRCFKSQRPLSWLARFSRNGLGKVGARASTALIQNNGMFADFYIFTFKILILFYKLCIPIGSSNMNQDYSSTEDIVLIVNCFWSKDLCFISRHKLLPTYQSWRWWICYIIHSLVYFLYRRYNLF